MKLSKSRRGLGLSQKAVARALGVSQPLVAKFEDGSRRLRRIHAEGLVGLGFSPEFLPLPEEMELGSVSPDRLAAELGALGYPGYGYARTQVKSDEMKNPSEALLEALAQDELEPRLAEALPWVLLRYWRGGFDWLVDQAKKFNLQNRLGFVASLAREVSKQRGDEERTRMLVKLEAKLGLSRLAAETSFGVVSEADRRWAHRNRSEAAKHWNVVSGLKPEHLSYDGDL